MQHINKSFCVLILAAGKGTRMRSKTPKVLHNMLEEPLLFYPISAIKEAGFENIGVVAGFAGEQVEEWLGSEFPDIKVIWQREQLGTGHAVKLSQEWWSEYEHVMILPGDTPLITSQTLIKFAERHLQNLNMCSFLSFELQNPAGYGRVIRDGLSVRIVEHKDATPDEQKCREVNSGMYVFDTRELALVIDELKCGNSQNEYYLPDTLALIEKTGAKVDAVKADNFSEFIGINDPKQLAEAAVVMRDRILNKWMAAGVKCLDPISTWIGPKAVLGEDITIEPNVQMWGRTSIGSSSTIGSFTVLNNAEICENVKIVGSVRINNSKIGKGTSVGPFVFIRDNAVLSDNVHVGRFVEIKKSVISEGAKVPHLSYIGDADIGTNTNIGAGTITCNYDGENKNRTTIGDNCFIGSDTMLVAPVTLGDDVTTAAGSVITKNIPDGSLGIGRARQSNIEGWSSRRKSQKGGK